MKVFRNYTLKSLLKSRSRTLVTIIGIILSMALFTAVIESVYSGIQFIISVQKETSGSWNGAFPAITEQQSAVLKEDSQVLRAGALRMSVDSLKLPARNGEENEELMLGEICDEELQTLAGIRITAGRLPENDSEVILPDYTRHGYVVGDDISLSGGRTLNVSGFFARRSGMFNQYLNDGRYAMTGPSKNNAAGIRLVFFELKDPAEFEEFTEKHGELGQVIPNVELLQYYGVMGDNRLFDLLWSFAGVLVALVVFGSVALIYNSFAISVNERTKQYGILKSIGATRMQIRFCVLYEALLLCLIGIPLGLALGCAGIGITFYALGGAFRSLADGLAQAELKLVISPRPLFFSALISLLTTLAAAWIPSVRAVKISPMEAIRQTKDVRLKEKKLRVNPIIKKIFGFSGLLAAKSMKRSRRQYRAISISLFMSIVLFVGASAFCSYLEDSAGNTDAFSETADILVHLDLRDSDLLDDLKRQFEGLSGVSKASYCIYGHTSFYFPVSSMDDSFRSMVVTLSEQNKGFLAPGALSYENEYGKTDDGFYNVRGYAAFLDDEDFCSLLKAEGLKEDDFLEPEHPRGLALNHGAFTDFDFDNQTSELYLYRVLKKSAAPAEGFCEKRLYLDGYSTYGAYTKPDGSVWAAFIPIEDLDRFYEGSEKEDFEPDFSLAMLLPPEEGLIRDTFEAAAFSEESISAMPRDQFILLYPYSMLASGTGTVFFDDWRTDTMRVTFGIEARGFSDPESEIQSLLQTGNAGSFSLDNLAKQQEQIRMLILVIHVFSYGFIILISLIAAANVFNTISTGIMLRRREFAMLKSIGLADRGILRILNCECLICGLRALFFGLPASVLVSWLIYRAVGSMLLDFSIPWKSMAIAAGSVFIVVFASMLYAAGKLRKDNVIEAVKREA